MDRTHNKQLTRPKYMTDSICKCQSCGRRVGVRANPAHNEEVVVLECFSCNKGGDPIVRYQLKIL